ncbi:MAG: GNAT family N-acetyltransferase [Acetatifactor sp.]
MALDYVIRVAEEKDAQAVHDIYGEYVDRLDVTFTVTNPSVEEYREKIISTVKMYPFYVAEDSRGNILGYCCGSRLRPHDAYRWNVESTIMLSKEAPRRRGIATALYARFMQTLKEQHFQYVYGVLVDTNEASIALHEALGFVEVGHFERAGYKKGEWLGILWMQKYIGDENAEVLEPIPFEMMSNV